MIPSVLGPLGKPHWSLLRTIKECNRFCPLVLELWLQPGAACLRNELCWQGPVGKLSQRGFPPGSPIWKSWLLGRKPSFELWDACVSASAVPHPGEGRNFSAVSKVCPQAEASALTPDLCGSPGKTHAYSDMRLKQGVVGGRRARLSLLLLCVTHS